MDLKFKSSITSQSRHRWRSN